MAFSSDRILTLKELRVGQLVHSGFSGGFCVKWKVVAVENYAVFRHGGTVALVDGIQLRKWPTYRPETCPNCDKQKPVETVSAEVKFLTQDLTPSVMASAFRFREAQYVMRRRNVTR